jgi:hypothetical protein
MRLGLGLYLAPISRPSSEQFVFYCGAVHTQLRAAGACLKGHLPVNINCTPVATLHLRSIRLRTPILGGPNDTSQFVAHVTVENAGKQRFPVPCSLIDEIATPPGQIYSHSEQKFVEMPKTAAV